ncbi:MAG: hypothetical protein SZ59_C0004G0019 [candidate division TM6 bacterium GW2011_GWF2_28_16]|nr:MAG: hypothetical protein SZ59_C0004G0019 [candidate division TM6 bacterium GW2011_GWF2_28_16]
MSKNSLFGYKIFLTNRAQKEIKKLTKIDRDNVSIIFVGHRKKVYQEFKNMFG